MRYFPLSFNPLTWWRKNFHTVEEKKVYRSKTVHKKTLVQIIDTYQIKTVLLLRPADPNAQWYQDELNVLQEKNIVLISHPLNPHQYPSKEQVQKIYNYFTTMEYPILIHCKAGADRTGLVCALWCLYTGKTLEHALAQQTLKRGHMRWFYPHMRKTTLYIHALMKQHGTLEKAVAHYNVDDMRD